jgi:hypothetical protein
MTIGHLRRIAVFALFFVVSCGILMVGPWCTGVFGAEGDDFQYVGVKKCKICHKKAEAGEQFPIWEKSGHAKAFETLATDAAKEEAAKHGIDDPQAAPECLKCHATAAAVMADLENQTITLEEGVSCESCHGPGSEYKSKKVMAAIYAGETDGATVGLITPTEETCKQCHTPEGNAFYKEFVFADRVKEIAHPVPAAE